MEDKYNMRYSLPSEINSEFRIHRLISARTIVVLITFAYLGMQLSNVVYEPFRIPFYIFNMIVGVLFCVPSQKNKQKRLYQSVIIMLFRNRRYYAPISNPDEMPDTVRKYIKYQGGVNDNE